MKRTLIGVSLVALSMTQAFGFGFGLQGAVDGLIQRINPKVNLGAVVVDLNTGETLYKRNADNLFIPASNMKLFSEAAALMALGPDYHFKNQLITNASQLKDGVLHGDVYLRLSGDPSFSRDNLKTLLSSLREWHIQTIDGNVYIDSSLSAVTAYPPGWLKSDLSYSYGAPTAPLILDANRLMVTVNPGAHVGDPAIVEADDGGGAIVVHSQAVTKASEKGCGVGLSLNAENELTVSGCVGLGQWAVQQKIALKNPLKYAKAMVRSILTEENINLSGQVQLGKAPAGAMIMATQSSMPLSQLMADTLKPSDNLYADSLYLHAASKLNGSPLNWREAQAVVKRFLQQQTGIDLSRSTFTDGSGLSRYNLVTPAQTNALLVFLYQRFPLAYEYIAALPISGRDGTLKKRFKNLNQQGFVRAKTGTMTGMNSLSGYLYTANGHTLAFSLFINRQPGSSAGPGRPVLDALCTYFLQVSPGSNRVASSKSAHSRLQFQSSPTQADVQRRHSAVWRGLESQVRLALRGQSVHVAFRGHELVVTDNQTDAQKVWAALQSVAKKYPFSVTLSSNSAFVGTGKPLLLWMQDSKETAGRTWVIHEAV